MVDFNVLHKEMTQKLETYINENGIKYIFCDMDGVVAEFSHNGQVNIDKWLEPNIFSSRRACLSITEKLKSFSLNCNVKIIILSASPNNRSNAEKYEWLRKYMPFIDIQNDVYLIGNAAYKLNTMNEIVSELKDVEKYECLLIEDTHSILFEAETEGYYAWHVSSMID